MQRLQRLAVNDRGLPLTHGWRQLHPQPDRQSCARVSQRWQPRSQAATELAETYQLSAHEADADVHHFLNNW